MTQDQLALYYFAYNVKWEKVTAQEAGLSGLYAVPWSMVEGYKFTLPFAPVMVQVVVTSPLQMVMGGATIAYVVTTRSEYQSKMMALESARVLKPTDVIVRPVSFEQVAVVSGAMLLKNSGTFHGEKGTVISVELQMSANGCTGASVDAQNGANIVRGMSVQDPEQEPGARGCVKAVLAALQNAASEATRNGLWDVFEDIFMTTKRILIEMFGATFG